VFPIEDGFKPVQRRIMHSLKELDDGRYNKVANVVGHTMQYHPHGMQVSVMQWYRWSKKITD
jgi:topoisomerase-4 subunit A